MLLRARGLGLPARHDLSPPLLPAATVATVGHHERARRIPPSAGLVTSFGHSSPTGLCEPLLLTQQKMQTELAQIYCSILDFLFATLSSHFYNEGAMDEVSDTISSLGSLILGVGGIAAYSYMSYQSKIALEMGVSFTRMGLETAVVLSEEHLAPSAKAHRLGAIFVKVCHCQILAPLQMLRFVSLASAEWHLRAMPGQRGSGLHPLLRQGVDRAARIRQRGGPLQPVRVPALPRDKAAHVPVRRGGLFP